MNPNEISKINLEPDVVDCIVFWSKNPKPLLEKLQLLNEYTYYFLFTLNPYDTDIETKLPPKKEIMETFKELSQKIGPQRVIWRYDPVLLNDRYTVAYHIDKFNEYARHLKGFTEKVIFSFIDFYKRIAGNIKAHGIIEITTEHKNILAENFSKIAKENALLIDTCAEDIDLSRYNIERARCIDGGLIAKITGYNLAAGKDKNQRIECGCVESIDIGEYNSCLNGCVYCYANNSQDIVTDNYKKHNQFSQFLTGDQNITGIISERKVSSNRILQEKLF
jgi:hypothetical protein